MKVSIICPLFNKAKYLKETFDSVCNQTYTNWELIIVDDGSTDGSERLTEKYYSQENRIKLYHRRNFNPRKGASVCRNIGIQLSSGRYVIFLDADDLLSENCLEERIRVVLKFPGNGFYVFPTKIFLKKPERLSGKDFLLKYKNRLVYFFIKNKREHFLKMFCAYDIPWHTTGPIWQLDTLKKLNGFTENFQRLQDPELHIRALASSSVSFCTFLNRSPDAFIRVEEGRRTTVPIAHFQNHSSAIVLLITFFSNYFEKEDLKKYVPLFRGYILSVEQLYTWCRYTFPKEQNEFTLLLNNFYKEQIISSFLTKRFNCFVSLLRRVSENRVFFKLKVYSILVLLYKAIL